MSEKAEGYVVPQSDDEAARLRRQSAFIERPSRYVIEQAGLAPGMSALDVGCGAGDLMQLMGEVVGTQGKVTGIDLNGDLGLRSTAALNAKGIASFAFFAGNFMEMPSSPSGPFDLVISRLVYLHLREPEEATRRLWSWVRPGGVLAIMEHDFRLLGSEPETDAAAIIRELFHAVFEHAGLDGRRGAKLPSFIKAATGGDPDGVEATTRLIATKDLAEYLQSTYLGYMAVAERFGIGGLPSRSTFAASVEQALREEARFFLPLLISAWKKKPLAS